LDTRKTNVAQNVVTLLLTQKSEILPKCNYRLLFGNVFWIKPEGL